MIVHVVFKCDPNRFIGGVSKMVLDLARAQSSTDTIQIWTIDNEHPRTEQINETLKIRWFRGKTSLGVCKSEEIKLEMRNSSHQISVLHGHNTFHPLNRQIGKAARDNNLPVFFHPHGAIDTPLLHGFGIRQLKKKAYLSLLEVPNLNTSTGVFALTILEKQQLKKFGVTCPIHVLPNGVDTDLLRDTSLRKSLFDYDPYTNDFRILYLGRITPKKGLHDLIPAFAMLKEQYPNAILQIAGDTTTEPVYAKQLRLLASKLNVEPFVKWLGFVDESGKKELFAQANIFVHASYSEGMAMSILESMARGVPVVATKGCYFSVAADAGALIECDQGAEAMCDAFGKILSLPDRGMNIANVATEYLKDSHCWKNIAKKMFNVYQSS